MRAPRIPRSQKHPAVLTERQERVLLLSVGHFIRTAEPVASRTLARHYDMGWSTATIRNEMSDLEAAGYLEQPHTSAGRVPTDAGYRAYVDALERVGLAERERAGLQRLEERYLATSSDLQNLLRGAARVLAEMTHLLGVAAFPRWGQSRLERLQLVDLGRGRVLVVLVTDAGVVETHMFSTDIEIPQLALDAISRIFQENFSHASIRALIEGHVEVLREIRTEHRAAVKSLLERFFSTLAHTPETTVVVEGEPTVFDQPEFASVDRAREILTGLAAKGEIVRMVRNLHGSVEDATPEVRIGSETQAPSLRDMAVVAAACTIPGDIPAAIGIIGPRRMPYPKVIAAVAHISEILARRLRHVGA